MSVREEVENYVEKRPYIQEALAEEIVNCSALARKIEPEIGGGFEAIKMALRRYQEEMQGQRKQRQEDITQVLGETAVELKNNIKVCKTDELSDAEIYAKTENGYTLILDNGEECSGEVIEDQVVVTLKSPNSLEDTPGVLAYILSILAGREINLTEVISCREDTHLIIDEEDATETFQLLNEKLKYKYVAGLAIVDFVDSLHSTLFLLGYQPRPWRLFYGFPH